jgi:hypothetical protein
MAEPLPIEDEGKTGSATEQVFTCLRCRSAEATDQLDLGAGLLLAVCESGPKRVRI